jgi:uncharacterized HAD superfamily protein
MERVALVRYGIDIDGVICDMHLGFAKVVNSLYPGRIPIGAEYPPEWDLTSLGISRAEMGEVWRKIGSTPNWWYSLPAIYQNVSAVFRHRLRHPDEEIFYVTARSTVTAGMPIMHQSQRWLEACGIGGVGTSVIVVPKGQSKADVYDDIGVERAVDDCPDVVREAPRVIKLLDRQWNKNDREGLTVVENLEAFFCADT